MLDAAAWAAGEVAWTKARDMLKVLTPDNEAAWVERAKNVTSRQLEDDLDQTLMGEPPPSRTSERRAPSRQRLVFHVDTSDAEVIRTVIQWARSQLGEERDDVSDGEILASLVQRVMHDVPSDTAPTAERFRIVVQHCPDCGRTDAPDCELTEAVVAEAGCDAEVVELRDGPARGHLTHTIPPAVRRTVLHRDRCRCRVPGCDNRLFLDLHHLRSRTSGGRHDLANLLTVCSVHHRLIHDGRLAVETVPGGLRFTFPTGRVVTAPLDPASDRAWPWCTSPGTVAAPPTPRGAATPS
jgi:5-methylcytosine-specific restriction endonuclease McrA